MITFGYNQVNLIFPPNKTFGSQMGILLFAAIIGITVISVKRKKKKSALAAANNNI